MLTMNVTGQYVATILPKYVQDVRMTSLNELEILIHPEGIFYLLKLYSSKENMRPRP